MPTPAHLITLFVALLTGALALENAAEEFIPTGNVVADLLRLSRLHANLQPLGLSCLSLALHDLANSGRFTNVGWFGEVAHGICHQPGTADGARSHTRWLQRFKKDMVLFLAAHNRECGWQEYGLPTLRELLRGLHNGNVACLEKLNELCTLFLVAQGVVEGLELK